MSNINFDVFKEMASDSLNNIVVVWNGLEIKVTPTLSLHQIMEFQNKIVVSCFDQETGEYTPGYRDIAVKRGLIEYYTNIDLPASVLDWYEIVTASGLLGKILESINQDQFNEMLTSANAEIEYEKEINAAGVMAKINSMADSMAELSKGIGELVENINKEDIENFARSVAAERYKDVDFVKEVAHSLAKRDVNGNKVVSINGNDN